MMPWREQEKEQIKSLEKQVKHLKQNYEEEKRQKGNLQLQVDQLSRDHGATGNRLLSANELAEKLGTDLKKCKEVLEKSQREQSQTEDRCHQLELRASGVDQAEIAVQTTQKALESCQFRFREQERRLGLLTEEHEQTVKALETAESRVKHLERRGEDLNYQVLQELIKNEKIEKKIESVPYLEEKISDLEKTVKQQNREVEQKGSLLMSSRKTTREYKEKLRDQEGHLRKVKEIQDELDLSKSEVMTLKKLLNGKDVLVFQKSQALDFAKDVIETLQYSCEAKVERVQELIERSCHLLSSQSASSSGSLTLTARSSGTNADFEFSTNESSSESTRKYARPWSVAATSRNHDNRNSNGYRRFGNQDNGFLQKLLTETDLKENHQPKTTPRNHRSPDKRPYTTQSSPSKIAWYGPSKKTLIHRSESQTRMRYRPSSDLINSPEDTEIVTISQNESSDNNNNNPSTQIKMADIVNRIVTETSVGDFPIRQDDIYSLFINLGARIFVRFPEHQRQRSARNSLLQRFGNKPVPKKKLYCGIVKYKGALESGQTHLYVGVNLDEPVGDTDGKLGEKRYMYTTGEHGKFVHIHSVVSVFDVQSSRYVELSALKDRFSQTFQKPDRRQHLSDIIYF